MSDGLSYLSTFIRTSYDMEHLWTAPYAAFSGDCPIYRTYKTKDDKWVAVGALEPKFNTSLFRVLGMDTTMNDVYTDPAGIAIKMEEIFRTKTRDEWIKSFSGQNACVTPVLELGEAVHFEHNLERNSFIEENKLFYPAPAPKMYSLEEYTKLNSKL
ncbi:hypothetical protein DICVIV_01597 [Dictyocaulus viviparus]|uniref:Uncharacterized protein n=1 Tax=Dictyocaulus viviparus TaxID=29172 RepID=A0A0D8Y8G9_DICVI|nr:hypothetical protein DICVIV_01597 [Dictyocaulus viviparus]